jgi:hypothetical protein
MTEETITWLAGVDSGSEKHHACLLDAPGTIVGQRACSHSAVGLGEQGEGILSIAGAASAVAVAVEVPHGPVVDALIDRGFVVYAINPKQLDRLRAPHPSAEGTSTLLIWALPSATTNCSPR